MYTWFHVQLDQKILKGLYCWCPLKRHSDMLRRTDLKQHAIPRKKFGRGEKKKINLADGRFLTQGIDEIEIPTRTLVVLYISISISYYVLGV